jgi:short-subunit dehydrogenase
VDDKVREPGRARVERAGDGRRRTHARGEPTRQSLSVDRIAVITGASSGIGEAIARALAARGWHTVLLARREDRLRALAAELGGEYEVCDVGRRDEVERVAASVIARHPRIDLLVNNAGIPGRASFSAIDPERLEQLIRVNYLGNVWCLRAFLPALEIAGRADVVNIVSIAGAVSSAAAGPYCASKHAQLAFSRASGAELRARGIHVHSVSPGFVETEGFPQAARFRSRALRRLIVDPDYVARHVLKVIDRDRRETFVPRWYRAAAIAQALMPALVARLSARR